MTPKPFPGITRYASALVSLPASSAAIALALLASCASPDLPPPARDAAYPFPEREVFIQEEPSELQKTVVKGGLSLVGKKELVVNGKHYPMDCTGVVRAAYAFGGVDLAYRFSDYSGNGVSRLYLTLRDSGLLYAVRYPAPGDLIFWDNTYDRNGNGRADDDLTHVGLVVSVEPDGTISYLHYNYRLGPIVEKMNLLHPNDAYLFTKGASTLANSPMRKRGSPTILETNSAQLFRVFGMGYKLKK
jgi:hypothetical protein